ncbi:uncharacterized protein BX663DRAFT_497205 [Cokeromyces recurvatus]|uniref:uncharacterized protein n=1 Tax=Cokeromyces recurvatus TaxID=90255 RepID=UPI00221EF862|nr:uncharacterized protein BX663DRAFT_497205 [Cokeromyces recurvatus]KAI7906655.1 hypothetical protein BX663DRAFT_497205 [Cokeromyces recurvatus]
MSEKGKEKLIVKQEEEEEYDAALDDFNRPPTEAEMLEIAELRAFDDMMAEEDDDHDSLDDWLDETPHVRSDDEEMDDEINVQLQTIVEQRERFRTGGIEELERDMEEFDNNLALTTGIGAKKIRGSLRKRMQAGEFKFSEEGKQRFGQANSLYIARDYGQAISLLQEIITEHPNAHPAWNTLGLVHEELGNNEKSIKFRMVAAHLCNDIKLWKELALKSIENDVPKQAIYCLTKVLTLDPTDVDALWDRSFLFKQLDKNQLAIDGFLAILEQMPHHFKVINELAQLYRQQGRTKEAIQLYEDAIVHHSKNDKYGNGNDSEEEEEEEEEDEFQDRLGYSEINMLSELYLILNDYRRSLDTIKTGLRHIQKRQNETWWADRIDDDDEYLSEEGDIPRTDFPIELRVRMGICRLYLNQVRLATRHFQYLLQYPPTIYPDLHQDIAYAYYDKRHYDLAVMVFQRIIDSSEEIEVDLLIRTADCYREIGDLETAVVFYVNVLDEQPNNLDVMMSLATVYEEQGKEDKALELVEYVMKKNREERRHKKALSTADMLIEHDRAIKRNKKASLFDEKPMQLTKNEYYRIKRMERQKQEEEKIYATKALFDKLQELDECTGPKLIEMDRTMMRDYMRNAQELWEDFRSTTAFYPSLRATRFQGFYALRRGKRAFSGDDIHLEARNMASRLRPKVKTEDGQQPKIEEDEEERQMREEEERRERMLAASHFRTIPFDKWHRTFIKYAYMLAITKRADEAYELLKKAIEANVFYHDIPKKTALYLALIGCGLIGKKEYIAQEGARWLCNFYQFKNDPFRIYTAVVDASSPTGNSSIAYSQIKYLNRMVQLNDAIAAKNRTKEQNDGKGTEDEIQRLNDAVMGMEVVVNAELNDDNISDDIDEGDNGSNTNYPEFRAFQYVPSAVNKNDTTRTVRNLGLTDVTYVNPILLTAIGHMMTFSKNHTAASLFHMRALALARKDPVNRLSLGLALLHTAVNRRTDNRHLQIMQGMMFLQEYERLSESKQEAAYNLARAFHMLGLTHLATKHYERVLCMPSIKKAPLVGSLMKPLDEVYKWPVSEEEQKELEQDMDDETDLKSEAAYNLHHIYITSGNMYLAQLLLSKYCTI